MMNSSNNLQFDFPPVNHGQVAQDPLRALREALEFAQEEEKPLKSLSPAAMLWTFLIVGNKPKKGDAADAQTDVVN